MLQLIVKPTRTPSSSSTWPRASPRTLSLLSAAFFFNLRFSFRSLSPALRPPWIICSCNCFNLEIKTATFLSTKFSFVLLLLFYVIDFIWYWTFLEGTVNCKSLIIIVEKYRYWHFVVIIAEDLRMGWQQLLLQKCKKKNWKRKKLLKYIWKA